MQFLSYSTYRDCVQWPLVTRELLLHTCVLGPVLLEWFYCAVQKFWLAQKRKELSPSQQPVPATCRVGGGASSVTLVCLHLYEMPR